MKENHQKASDSSSKASAHHVGNGRGISVGHPFQAKLTIGAVNDPLEQEADAMADKLMRMPASQQPMPLSSSPSNTPVPESPKEASGKEEKEPIAESLHGFQGGAAYNALPVPPADNKNNGSMSAFIQRKCESCEQEERERSVHRKERRHEPPQVNNEFESYVSSLGSSGSALSTETKAFFEPKFGMPFSDVRVHSDALAAKSADSINALAYTTGNNIVFNQNQYSPETDAGKKLLAHELTHVVQQKGANGKDEYRNSSGVDLSTMKVHPMIQRDLAIAPPRPDAVGRVLTPEEIAEAITFNNGVLGSIDNSADIIEMIRDVIGISSLPAVVDEDFVNGVTQWQANFGLAQDGRLGPTTARPLFREIGAEGVGRGEVTRGPLYRPAGPINVARAGARAAHFDMDAEFRSDPANGIFPSCCEVRQDIQWDAAFVAASVAAGNGTVPHGGFPAAHPADTWIEDRNAGDTLRYGHRARFDRGPGNRYLRAAGRQNQAFGHIFEGEDNPQGLADDRGSWSFRLRVIDVCNGNRQLAVSPTLVVNWL